MLDALSDLARVQGANDAFVPMESQNVVLVPVPQAEIEVGVVQCPRPYPAAGQNTVELPAVRPCLGHEWQAFAPPPCVIHRAACGWCRQTGTQLALMTLGLAMVIVLAIPYPYLPRSFQ